MSNIKTILVIDSTIGNLDTFTEYLELSGFTVTGIDNHTEGIIKAKTLLPDLIICDSKGFGDCPCTETLHILKSSPETSNIPVIITSTNSSLKFREDCLKNEAAAFLLKPFSLEVLLNNILNTATTRTIIAA